MSIDKRQKPTDISQYDIIYFDDFIIEICQLVVTKIYHSSFPFLWFQHLNFSPLGRLERSSLLCYNGYNKNPPRAELLTHVRWRQVGVYDRHWAASNCVLTTILTIYGFGLRGNYGFHSTKKHVFRTKKHEKARKMRQKTDAFAFGTSMPQVRTLSLRPHENNPNILLLGEAFGLFVLFEYPNFNSKK